MKVFTKEELAQYDGKDGKPTYVAVKGKVYDVSGSEQWEDGEHQFMHNSGKDLSDEILGAPHDEDVLSGFKVVGTLAEK